MAAVLAGCAAVVSACAGDGNPIRTGPGSASGGNSFGVGGSGFSGASGGAAGNGGFTPNGGTAGVGATGGFGESGGSPSNGGAPPFDGGPNDGGATPGDAGTIHGPFTGAQLAAQGCDPTRPAFAYRAGTGKTTTAVDAPSGFAPVPCLSLTGLGSAEASLGMTSDGTPFYAPSFSSDGTGVLSSNDFGASWNVHLPKFSNGGTMGRVQPYLYVDPKTDRLFFATTASSGTTSPSGSGFNLVMSADKGATWTYANVATDASDWMKVFAGPPVTSKPTNYPNVVYVSAPAPISTPVPIVSLLGLTPNYQSFYKSLDGGATWLPGAHVDIKAADVPNCDPNEWVIFGSGTVGPDGTVYQVLRRCTRLAIAVSTDEAATFTIHEIPGASMPAYNVTNLVGIVENANVLAMEFLTADSAGNLYIAWPDGDGVLRLTVSKDHAATWSTPVAIAAPAVKVVSYASVTAKVPGTIAVVYYGSSDGEKTDAYIAESTNALDATPTFWTVTVNAPSDPMYPRGFEDGHVALLAGGDLNEIIQVKYAPNGDLWASFAKQMCKGMDVTQCTWDAKAHANSVFQGAIGRMVHGVAGHWSTSPERLPDPPPDCATSQAVTDQCTIIATGEGICTALETCACANCACPLLDCQKNADCAAVRECATKQNCRGVDCIFSCQPSLLTAGALETSNALKVADCLTASSCPASCP